VPGIESSFLSLDFIYVPTRDVDSTARHYVDVLGADLRRKVRGIPHGPLASFEAAGGQRFAVDQLTRPEAAGKFDGIVDEPQ
jgi:hypothetical protein